jgi:diaminopimelate epimerase
MNLISRAPAVGSALAFAKLHGAGNDFMLVEDFAQPAPLNYRELAKATSDRRTGVGFDQLMVLTKNSQSGSGFGYLIYNRDGTAAQQCGNGARAIAWWLMQRHGLRAPFELIAPAGKVMVSVAPASVSASAAATFAPNATIGVSLGKPKFTPDSIPLARPNLALRYQTKVNSAAIEFSCVGLGNPHATIFVPSVATAEVASIGAALQQHADFPERVNVGFCEPISRQRAKLRVFERGTGETLACGSGACAAAVNLIRLGLSDRTVTLELPGGTLEVSWLDDQAEVILRGPVVHVYDASMPLPAGYLAAVAAKPKPR